MRKISCLEVIGGAWDYDPDKDPDLREMIRRRLRELKPGMRVRSTYTREYGTISSIEGEEIFIDWDDGDYSPVSVGAITPIDQGMQLRLAAPNPDQMHIPLRPGRWEVWIEEPSGFGRQLAGIFDSPQKAQDSAVDWSSKGYVSTVRPENPSW